MENLQQTAAPGIPETGVAAGVTAEAAAQHHTGVNPAAGQEASDAGMQQEDLNAAFETLIKGKFKAQYDERVQEIVRKRVKDSKENPTPEGSRAGFDEGVLAQICGHWKQQEQETASLYPGFRMEQELQDPRFVRLITGGVNLRTAYEALHHHEILPAAMEFAARAAETAMVKRIAAGAVRPAESGMGSRAPAVVKGDVSRMSRSDIEEVARRVARGERVSFG